VISGIQFTKHFIEFVVGETNQLFGGNSNVNLTRQICGQRSGMAAGTPRPSGSILLFRTNLLYVPNIEMYRMVGSRSVHDFRTCKENAAAQCRLPIFQRVWPQDHQVRQNSPLRNGIPFASPEVMHRPRSDSSLHFDNGNISQIRTKNKMLTLGVCFPQPCPSAGHRLVASRTRLDHSRTIGSFPQQ